MNLSVNGQSQVPPGFRFHPTEEELLHYYLRKKVACQKIDLDVIRDVDLNRLEPWDIQEKCKIGSTPQNDWYFFSHKDKKYPTGTRTNRATAAGFWKATGRDKFIYSNCIRIGMRKTLVFYRGRAPNGRKSDWIMHEYRLDDSNVLDNSSTHRSNIGGADQAGAEEGWVVCRVFKKKNYHHSKASISPQLGSENSANNILDQILMYMGTSSSNNNNNRSENKSNNNHCSPEFPSPPTAPAFAHLPGLESPSANTISTDQARSLKSPGDEQLIADQIGPPSDWAALDRLVASQLNEHHNYPKHFSGMIGSSNIGDQLDMDSFTFGDDASINHHQIISSSQTNFWSFAPSTSSSSSDPVLSQLSV